MIKLDEIKSPNKEIKGVYWDKYENIYLYGESGNMFALDMNITTKLDEIKLPKINNN